MDYKERRGMKMVISNKIVLDFVGPRVMFFKAPGHDEHGNDIEHIVRLDRDTDEWTCSCWHFANRTAKDKDKYGECAHIIGSKEHKGQLERDGKL